MKEFTDLQGCHRIYDVLLRFLALVSRASGCEGLTAQADLTVSLCAHLAPPEPFRVHIAQLIAETYHVDHAALVASHQLERSFLELSPETALPPSCLDASPPQTCLALEVLNTSATETCTDSVAICSAIRHSLRCDRGAIACVPRSFGTCWITLLFFSNRKEQLLRKRGLEFEDVLLPFSSGAIGFRVRQWLVVALPLGSFAANPLGVLAEAPEIESELGQTLCLESCSPKGRKPLNPKRRHHRPLP